MKHCDLAVFTHAALASVIYDYLSSLPVKITWTAAEFENFGDFNRQKSNIEFIVTDTLAGLYYFPVHTAIADVDTETIPTIELINTLEGNLAGIESCGVALPSGWGASKTWVTGSTTRPDYADANRWEQNSKLIYDMAVLIRKSFKPAGTFAAGAGLILPRKVI